MLSLIMAEQDSVEIKGIITALQANINYNQQLNRWEFSAQAHGRIMKPQSELDTENILLTFTITDPSWRNISIV